MDENLKQIFQRLFEYQKKDIELRKLNNVLDKDEALVSMNKNKRAFNEAKQTLADCEQQAGSILDMYSELQKYVDDNDALLAELENADGDGESEVEARVKKLESLRSKFQTADKKMHDIEDKSKTVLKRRTDALKAGKVAQAAFGEAREKHNKLINSKADELNKLKAELEALKKSLDPSWYAEYEKLVTDNKFPPLVHATGDEKKNLFNCGGCGLNLPQKGNAMLGDQGWCRCENCRRLIVKLN
ncbi:MAG: hypothetical protein J1G01_01535 [Clostridiales bacterium]|nr:hypothetical protein [Clostridiales bacterium]